MEKPRINELPDDLLLKILSSLPSFPHTAATSLISKRWEGLWKLVPDLTLDDVTNRSRWTFKMVARRALGLNNTQTLERLRLKLGRKYSASAIDEWVKAAVDRSVREITINLIGKTLVLPSCLSTCTTLKTLILRDLTIKLDRPWFRLPSLKSLHLLSVMFLEDESAALLLTICPVLEYLVVNQTEVFSTKVPTLSTCTTLKTLTLYELSIGVVPPWLHLPSLKTLYLLSVKFSGDESVPSLLQICAVLEDLVINKTKNVMIFKINVPSLKRLSIHNSKGKHAYGEEFGGFVIKAPALEKLNIKDTVSYFLLLEYMPEVTKANIEVMCDQSEKFIGSLTSLQHLSFCSRTSKTPYPRGTVFPYLEHLELCTCSAGWPNLLASIFNDAPRLQSLKLKSKHRAHCIDPMDLWMEPTVVPECLTMCLEIIEWRQYEDTEQEREVAAYILANATCLKVGTFSSTCRNKYTELKKMSRVSETFQFVFQ